MAFLSRKFANTRLSIDFKDLLDSWIAPQNVPHCCPIKIANNYKNHVRYHRNCWFPFSKHGFIVQFGVFLKIHPNLGTESSLMHDVHSSTKLYRFIHVIFMTGCCIRPYRYHTPTQISEWQPDLTNQPSYLSTSLREMKWPTKRYKDGDYVG